MPGGAKAMVELTRTSVLWAITVVILGTSETGSIDVRPRASTRRGGQLWLLKVAYDTAVALLCLGKTEKETKRLVDLIMDSAIGIEDGGGE